jgi:hypothetical protein
MWRWQVMDSFRRSPVVRTPSERDFVKKRLIPLLRKLGFQHVRYTHGIDEYGRDVVFYDKDRFGVLRLYAGQAKLGDVSGKAGGEVDKIIAQVEDAFKMPYKDVHQGGEKHVASVYVMISGRFARNAKEKIAEKARGKAVFFLEGSDIENLETGGSPPRSAKEVAELERLYREALAASRTRTELALSVFEQKLHEIDLLASCSPQDRVETFDRLGFEVSLNSDSGTRLLVGHLLWQLCATENERLIEATLGLAPARLLTEAVAGSLWNIGLQAVEYRRNRETVEAVTKAIVHVARTGDVVKSEAARKSCETALRSMEEMARREGRDDVMGPIRDALRELSGPGSRRKHASP